MPYAGGIAGRRFPNDTLDAGPAGKSRLAGGSRALTELCTIYYEPVVTFLRCELRDADVARELAHDFFAQILAGGAIARAEQERGRFRSFLLGAV